jgi:hypothetical protein
MTTKNPHSRLESFPEKNGLPDCIGVGLSFGEEVDGFGDVVVVLVLPGQVVAGRAVAAFVGDLGGLVLKNNMCSRIHFKVEGSSSGKIYISQS